MTKMQSRLAEAAAAQRAQSLTDHNRAALGQVATVAERMMELEDLKEAAEAELKAISRELEEISTKTLPDVMQSVGIDEFRLTSGAKITVSQFVSASISEDHKVAAHKWLNDNGHGSLIKHNIDLSFGKGEDKLAQKAKEVLHKSKLTFTEQAGVHSSTLRAFVKEQLEAGVKIPLDLFGAFVGRKAKIKRP